MANGDGLEAELDPAEAPKAFVAEAEPEAEANGEEDRAVANGEAAEENAEKDAWGFLAGGTVACVDSFADFASPAGYRYIVSKSSFIGFRVTNQWDVLQPLCLGNFLLLDEAALAPVQRFPLQSLGRGMIG